MPNGFPELTEKQQAFVTNLTDPTVNTDPKTSTLHKLVPAMLRAGFKTGHKPEATAVRLLANKKVLKAVLAGVSHSAEMIDIRAEMTREMFQKELYQFLNWAKKREDGPAWKGALELFGKFMSYLTERHLITTERAEEMTDEQARELLELSKYRHLRSGSVIDAQLTDSASTTIDDNSGPVDCQGIDTMLLQGQSEAIASDDDIPDVAGDDDTQDHNSMQIDKSIDDKDLQI
jgi:hypothetical protein